MTSIAPRVLDLKVDLPVDPTLFISDLIAAHGARQPEVPAIICEDEVASWGQFDEQCSRFANALLALGLQKNDKVAMMALNSVAYAVAYYGTVRAGCCAVPLSGMATPDSIAAMIDDSGAKVMALGDRFRDLVEPILDDRKSILADGRIAFDFAAPGWRVWDDVLAASSPKDPQIKVGPKDHFNIIYSSGTTGVPKGILHSHHVRRLYYADRAERGFGPGCRTLLATPLYSNTTIFAMLPTVALGGTSVVMSKFDVKGLLELSEKERITHTMLVPVQYNRILAEPSFDDYDLSSYKLKFSTSAPLHQSVKEQLISRWPGGLIEIYGMTEGGVGCALVAHEHPDKLHTVGQPISDDFRIVDENMKDVAPGETGELVGTSDNMMLGYYNKEEQTTASRFVGPDGRVWQRSGDMGKFDEDGFVILLDRMKDMIISGGFNVYAADIETELMRHPDVVDCGVIGIPSKEWGESPYALAVLREGAEISADQLKDWLNSKVGKTQRVAGVEFRDSLPRSTIGKLLKRELRAPFWKDQERAI